MYLLLVVLEAMQVLIQLGIAECQSSFVLVFFAAFELPPASLPCPLSQSAPRRVLLLLTLEPCLPLDFFRWSLDMEPEGATFGSFFGGFSEVIVKRLLLTRFRLPKVSKGLIKSFECTLYFLYWCDPYLVSSISYIPLGCNPTILKRRWFFFFQMTS